MDRYTETASKLKVMGHPVRLQILDMLRQGEICVCHIETALGKRQAYISQQLMSLRDAGLVSARKHGLQVYYRLNDDLVADVLYLIHGISEQPQAEALNGCPCPQCSTVSIASSG
jgi:DNA-binding transcriptional ArsR family regulator